MTQEGRHSSPALIEAGNGVAFARSISEGGAAI
jgi:hypothetical protein